MQRVISELAKRPEVRCAREWLERHDQDTLALQRQIAAIPAPTGSEGARGDFIAERLAELDLRDLRRDAAGNVLTGYGASGRPGIVLAAHLDTVFPTKRAVAVREVRSRLVGPGITDNARGLAALVRVAAALQQARVETGRPITFAATAGEEGAGDLRGVRHLFEDSGFRPDAFIALDGAGLDRVVHRALGSRRLRALFRGPGGHSWAAFGVANPAHAVGLATVAIAELSLPTAPRGTASVVRIGGGSALNTIPQEAWLELDLRSESDAALEAIYGDVTRALGQALDAANRRRAGGTAPLSLHLVPLGSRPCGLTDASHHVVRAAVAATRFLGHRPELAAASTDANLPISLGVPGIALGAGGRGGDAHLDSEWYENTDGPAGVFRALLTILAVGEVAGRAET